MRLALPPLLVVLALLLPLGAAAREDAVSVVRRHYALLNDGDLKGAYMLRSAAARRKLSLATFRQNWQTCRSVGFYEGPREVSNDGHTAVVQYRIGSCDTLGADRLRYGNYQMRATLCQESGHWRIDRVEANQVDGNDAPLWEVDRPDLPVPTLPQDVPVPEGFKMGSPVAVKHREGGEISYDVRALRRVPAARPHDIGTWYLREMPARGWTERNGLAGGGSALAVAFQKGNWQVSILVTSTTWGGTDAPADPRGTTLEFSFTRIK